jgi:hypothetical protein
MALDLAAIAAAAGLAGIVAGAIARGRSNGNASSELDRADVTAFVNEQVVFMLAQRIGRGIEDVRAVLRGGGRADIAKRLLETRWYATVQFQKLERDCLVRVVVSFPGARAVRSRRVDWRDIPPHVRTELMRSSRAVVDRPWQTLWVDQVAA